MKADIRYSMFPFKGVPSQKLLDDGFAIGSAVEPDLGLVEARLALHRAKNRLTSTIDCTGRTKKILRNHLFLRLTHRFSETIIR